MHYLEGVEKTAADSFIYEAVTEALMSRCEKSKRGVVIVKSGEVIGRGCNNPPLEMQCNPDYCLPICRHYCVHAEQNAIIDCLKRGISPEGSRAYHIKVKDGTVKSSGQPSCVECSKLVLQSGIAEFVLKDEQGYKVFGAREFHELSLAFLTENSK